MNNYPATFDLDAPLKVANWRPLVQWILAIPHLLIAQVLGSVGGVIALISWFAIVFTGNLPEGLANFQCLVTRYRARAMSYAAFLHETYPGFEFSMTAADPGGDPVRVELQPQLENRNRLTVGLRAIWIIPAALWVALLSIAAAVVWFIAFFAVLFTGHWPEGMRRFVVNVQRVTTRLVAYASLLVDDYPPFVAE